MLGGGFLQIVHASIPDVARGAHPTLCSRVGRHGFRGYKGDRLAVVTQMLVFKYARKTQKQNDKSALLKNRESFIMAFVLKQSTFVLRDI